MARTARSRRKMANTTDTGHTVTGTSLLSTSNSTSFIDGSSTTYPTAPYSSESYSSFNYTSLANSFGVGGVGGVGGYALDDLNYTELWIDVWNNTEATNVTQRLNSTVLPPLGGYCDEWESAQHKLFQVYIHISIVNPIIQISAQTHLSLYLWAM